MEMMITDNIDFLNEAKNLFEDIANNPSVNETIKTYFIIESLESAVAIMRRYQKIQEIVKKWELDSWIDNLSYESMVQIREALEDDDNKYNVLSYSIN